MRRGRKAASPSLQEEQFQNAYSKWEASGYLDGDAWNIMFYRVHEVCNAIASKMCMGIYNHMFEDRVMDATIYFMNRIYKEHIHPNKLSSWCYLGVKGYIYGAKQQREDKELSYESFYSQEDGMDVAVDILGNTVEIGNNINEEIRGICRQELMNTLD